MEISDEVIKIIKYVLRDTDHFSGYKLIKKYGFRPNTIYRLRNKELKLETINLGSSLKLLKAYEDYKREEK